MVATIGYERASLADFIATLEICSIDVLVDIRDRAQSRRPGFSKSALRNALESASIEYIHLPELGDPKPGREAARQGNFTLFKQIFGEVLATEKAQLALKKLEQLASDSNICLMCYERDQLTCHRKIVADHLEKMTGRKASHLGVKDGAGKWATTRRMPDSYQSTAASI